MNDESLFPGRTARKPRRHRGFTLIELLVAIPVVGIMIATTVPLTQLGRCEAQSSLVSSNLVQIITIGVWDYIDDSNERCVPRQMDDLSGSFELYEDLVHNLRVTSVSDPDRIVSTFTDVDGVADFTYIYPPLAPEPTADWPPAPLPECLSETEIARTIPRSEALMFVAEGREFDFIVLGFLDGHTEVLDGACRQTIEEQLDALEDLGYEAIADLLSVNEASPEPIPPLLIKQSLSDPETITTAVRTIDLEPDGKYGADDLYALARIDVQTRQASALSDVGEDASTLAVLQILGEFARGAIEITGIPEDDPTEVDLETVLLYLLGQLPPGEEPPFEVTPLEEVLSYERLCQLTRLYVTDSGVADSLCAQLSAAAAAYDEGRPEAVNNILHAYRQHVDAVADKKISLRHAEILRALSYTQEAP